MSVGGRQLIYKCSNTKYNILKQVSNNGESVLSENTIIILISAMAAIFPIVELGCYIAFFHHTIRHDNTIAVCVIKPEALKQRNKRNAIRFGFYITVFAIYSARRLIGSRIIESAAYSNQILMAPLYLNSTLNT